MHKISVGILLFFVLAITGCGSGGGGSGDSHAPMGTLSVTVVDSADNQPVDDASVTVYDSSNTLVTRGLTDDGLFHYSLSPGTYTIKVAAQDYLPVPPTNQSAVPFEIIDDQTTTQNIALDEHPDAGTTGRISGYIVTQALGLSGVSGVLVVAKDDAQEIFSSGTSGPNGNYVIYNLKPGSYTLEVYLAGYREVSDPVTVDVVVKGSHVADDIEIEPHDNADLYGKLTFLAIVNGVVDITLLHPDTLDTIPGLSSSNDANALTYRLSSVPPGSYIAWASFRNDGYVMDPDWIYKNPGVLDVVFTASGGDVELNFSVTDSVTITSPTNEADLVVPMEVNTATPTFTWVKYPSAKEYIIEVFNSKGETIWGGFNDSGVVQHDHIGADATSAVFDFDDSAAVDLQDGKVYRWKIYADDSATQNVQTLLSSSEDQLGLFKYAAR